MSPQGFSRARDIAILVTLSLNLLGLAGAALKGLEWVATVNTNQATFQANQAQFEVNIKKLTERVDVVVSDVEKVKQRHLWEDATGKAPPPRKYHQE